MMDAGMQHACCSPCRPDVKSEVESIVSLDDHAPPLLLPLTYALMPLSLGLASLHALQAPAAHNQPSSSTRDDVSSVVTVRPDRPDAMPGFLLASPITRATDKKNLSMFDQLSAQGDTIGDLASYSTDLLHLLLQT